MHALGVYYVLGFGVLFACGHSNRRPRRAGVRIVVAAPKEGQTRVEGEVHRCV